MVAAYRCDCLAGYTGQHCNVDISECASDPCQHGASCIEETAAVYRCVCPAGYSGEQVPQSTCSTLIATRPRIVCETRFSMKKKFTFKLRHSTKLYVSSAHATVLGFSINVFLQIFKTTINSTWLTT